MAEVVGVVAAAGQLATACISLLDLARKIKGASSALKGYQQQLQELHSLSEAISRNPLLQTPEVGAHTYSLLTIVNDNNLKPLIGRGRFLRTWVFLFKDQELVEVLNNLERRKSSLALVIHNIQSQALHRVQSNIEVMANYRQFRHDSDDQDSQGSARLTSVDTYISPPSSNNHNSLSMALQPVADRSLVTASEGNPDDIDYTSIPDNRIRPEGLYKFDGQPHGYQSVSEMVPKMSLEELEIGLEKIRKIRGDHPGSGVFLDCLSSDGGTQLNGAVVTGGPEVGGILNSLLAGSPDVYVNCHTNGSGHQLNAARVRYSGPISIETPPPREDTHFFCTTIPRVGSNGEAIKGVQVNNIDIRKRGEEQAN